MSSIVWKGITPRCGPTWYRGLLGSVPVIHLRYSLTHAGNWEVCSQLPEMTSRNGGPWPYRGSIEAAKLVAEELVADWLKRAMLEKKS